MKLFTLLFKNTKRNKISIILFLAVSTFCIAGIHAQQVSTYAGTGNPGTLNGTTATCEFISPEQMAFDSHHNLYVADGQSKIIRKIDTEGNVTTFAGTGDAGYVDGPVAEAKFSTPIGIAIDKYDNIYISDNANYVIRKIDTLGIVSTFAGSGIPGFQDGSASEARFESPVYMCFDDSMNLYVVGTVSHAIRKIDSLGNVTTFVGNGTIGFENGTGPLATFHYPMSIVYDKFNHVFYISDQLNCAIRKVSLAGEVTTIAGTGVPGYQNGEGASAQFYFPKGLTLDSLGNIYVAGRQDQTIRKIDTQNNVTTVAGIPMMRGYIDGDISEARFSRPVSVLMDTDNNILVADNFNHVIRNVSLLTATGIDNKEQDGQVSVFPNPASDYIHIAFLKPADNLNIEIISITGQKVSMQSFSSSEDIRINIQDQAPGIYFAKIYADDGVRIVKFMVE